MMDEQGEHQEGWQANDLRTGVAKVFAEAKERNVLGVRVAGAWAALTIFYGLLNFSGATDVTPASWDVSVGAGAGLLASMALARTPGSLLGAAFAIIADLVVLSFNLPEVLEHGAVTDHAAVALRVLVAPVALVFVLNGYFGALSIQAFKKGFSPGADWRTRMNPKAVQVGIMLSCVGALLVGFFVWLGAVRAGLAQTDVVWISHYFFDATVELPTARPVEVREAKSQEDAGGLKFSLDMLNQQEPAIPEVVPYPDTAIPLNSLDGLEEYTREEIKDAWYFAEDSDEEGCLLEGQGRQDRCRDDRCKYWARVFVRGCLVRSRKTKDFCLNVPPPTRARDGEAWAQRACAGRPFESCRELLLGMQGHCHPPKPGELEARPKNEAPAQGAAK